MAETQKGVGGVGGGGGHFPRKKTEGKVARDRVEIMEGLKSLCPHWTMCHTYRLHARADTIDTIDIVPM